MQSFKKFNKILYIYGCGHKKKTKRSVYVSTDLF